jgi:hypothetical protein
MLNHIVAIVLARILLLKYGLHLLLSIRPAVNIYGKPIWLKVAQHKKMSEELISFGS